VSRAAASRGQADLDALRAFATLAGAGRQFEDLEEALGKSQRTDPQKNRALANLLNKLGTAVTLQLESRGERRLLILYSFGLAALLCEALQFSVVLTWTWFLGQGLAGQPGQALPFSAALKVAISSRGTTRLFRLAAEIWTARRIRRIVARVPARRRFGRVFGALGLIVAWVAGLTLILKSLDATIFSDSFRKMIQISRRRSAFYYDAPIVQLTRGTATFLLQPLLRPILEGVDLQHLVDPAAVARWTCSFCHFLHARVWDACVLNARFCYNAMRIKPLRAILELSETDSWLADALRGYR